MSLEELKQQRASTKKNLTRIKNLIEANGRGDGKPLSATELKCRLSIAEAYFKQILTYQHKIECLEPDDNSRAEFEDTIIAIQLSVQEQIGGDIHNSTLSESTLPSSSNRNHCKLPSLRLPTFSGKYSEYKNFITSFKQVIDREIGLSNIEKFNHLRNCLEGPALETINAFQITNENYTKALDRLKARFDNNTLIFLENITSLFDLPATCQPDGNQLRSIVDNASALYSSLSSLGTDREISDALLIHITMGKIDEDSRNKWKDSLDFSKLPKWDDFTNLLDRRCQYLQSIEVPRSPELKPASGKPQKLKKVSSFAVAKRCCSICDASDHYVANCNQFRGMDVSKRFDKVKQLRLCMNCLSSKHQVAQCTSNFKCRSCSKSHHSLLHRQQVQSHSPPTQQFDSSVQQQQPSLAPTAQSYGISHSHFQKSSFEQVILATAIVLVRGADGTYHPGRALLDSCSQVNFITDRFSQALKSTRKKQNVKIYGIGESSTNIKHTICSTIKSRFTDFELPLDFCVTAHISYQPEPEIDISSWNLPQNITLADENFHKSKHIDLLIGTEGFFDLLSVGQVKLGPDKPTLQKTLLGWVVSGRYSHGSKIATPQTCLMTFEQDVDARLERLWLLEEVNREKKPWTPEQIDCESHFLKTVSRNPEGRIIVRLPFKDNVSSLGQSFEVALRRFLSQEKRLSHQPALKAQYVDFMDEFKNLKHMSLATNLNRLKPHYYIPHHCVLKPTSTSTKLRVVFDASCKTTSQKSLNDILLVGPTIQEDLYILLLKFRLYQFAISADIVKMFRQVLIHEDDRSFQSILWRNTAQDEISTYHINTVAYGTASATYLAVRALHFLADTCAAEMPIGAQAIKNQFYVDDLLCGADTLAELQRIKTEVTEILQRGCFELAKWHSNHPKFVDENTVKNLRVDDAHITSTLGITWDQRRDKFLFAFKPPSKIDGPINKRSILSIASSLFDPLGLLSPLIIRSKIIMQELWLLKISWDESVPQFIHTAWEHFVADLNSLSSISVPRYCSTPNAHNIQLHGFCDSSIRGYGCCLYMRVVDTMGNISVKLLTAKSKVAPTKKKSLPKLELCGAKLLASVYDSTKSTYGHLVSDVFLWTDSKIVLFWLKQHSASLSAFVGNRVSDIQEITASCSWRHVPTKCNPADIVSRGCKVAELSSSIWFAGPSFLKLAFEQWPENNFGNPPIEEIEKERRKSTFHANIDPNYILHCLEKISSFTKILRIVSWLFRFRQPAHVQKRSSHLTPYDLQKALWCSVYNIQQQYFKEDIRRLKKNLPPEGSLKCLNPFLEETFGFLILKVGGRLEFANIPSSQKHPSILPNKCILVNCYVRHLHLSNYHAGAKTLVALIRNNFWIVNAREACRRIVQSCVHCVRYKPKLMQQIMGHLPHARVNECRPFQSCAVDFCGPINTYLRIRGKVPYKTYVAVFVCMVTKAVHIEVVSDLTTDAFLAALKRLIARRGPPDDIYCDNATNFVGASNRLAELKTFLFKKGTQNDIHTYCCNEFINFHFIPPRAPHFGGLWEAAVKAAKAHLNRTMMNTRLTFEELYTALVEIEAVLNSRPITPCSSDPSDLRALTPADLLYGCPLKSLPEKRPIIPKEICYMEHWARISAIKQRFWQQWSRDYLNELQCRTKWFKEAPNVTVGSMVVIHEDNLPPLRWTMGRVINCISGKDQKTRVVDIRTSKGTIRRPIHKLALLPT